jgi:hypothetical protein
MNAINGSDEAAVVRRRAETAAGLSCSRNRFGSRRRDTLRRSRAFTGSWRVVSYALIINGASRAPGGD